MCLMENDVKFEVLIEFYFYLEDVELFVESEESDEEESY